jgi:hypothetical protein
MIYSVNRVLVKIVIVKSAVGRLFGDTSGPTKVRSILAPKSDAVHSLDRRVRVLFGQLFLSLHCIIKNVLVSKPIFDPDLRNGM